MHKKWDTPKLIALVRKIEQENTLAVCKGGGELISPQNAIMRCNSMMDPESPCSSCVSITSS